LPSESEAVALLKIVLARYPVLKFRNTDGELDSFRGALAYICSLTKMPAPITKYAQVGGSTRRSSGVGRTVCGVWFEVCCRRSSQPATCNIRSTTAAPFGSTPTARGRAVDAQAWRKVLDGSGDLIAPTKLDVFVERSIGLQRVQVAW
jgi:hypothetical protein